MRKVILIVSAFLIALFLFSRIYVSIGQSNIHSEMEKYIENRGIEKNELISIEVKHSFISIILCYDEWVIWVKYKDEPNSTYFYTYRNHAVISTGVAGVPEGNVYKYGDPLPIVR